MPTPYKIFIVVATVAVIALLAATVVAVNRESVAQERLQKDVSGFVSWYQSQMEAPCE